MLQHIPRALGRALRPLRPGTGAVSLCRAGFDTAPGALALRSPAFADGAAMPARFTADGAGASPPLRWDAPPPGTAELVLIVEDADSPTPRPLVHAIVLALPPGAGELFEGAMTPAGGDGGAAPAMGRNSYLSGRWLPPDPPTGHGPHRYVFQAFALSAPLRLAGTPGRGRVLRAMRGRVLATGRMTGTYERA